MAHWPASDARADTDADDRDPGGDRLLHDLVPAPPADHEHGPGQRQPAAEQEAAKDCPPRCAAREDVGRHNAVDKLVGWGVLGGRLPLSGTVLMVSGRCGYEIVQKAVAAGIPVVASVSAPSSLAVAVAEDFGLTLVGFLRGRRCNVYAGRERLQLPVPAVP